MGLLAPVEIAEYLGLRPTWVDGTGVGGSTWEFMVEHATAAILAGHVETVVLVYGSTTRADLKARRRSANLSFGARGPVQFDAPFGHTLISKYAMAARRHMHEFGTTIEQLAEIAVSTRYNASLQPRGVLPRPDHDRRRAERAHDRRPAHEAALLHPQRRRRRGRAHRPRSGPATCPRQPVWVLGTGEATSHTTMSEWDDFTESPAARSGQLAFERAGVTPDDIDICQIYDAFTLDGAARRSKASASARRAKAARSSRTASCGVGGALPTNTDGGGLSHCHPGMRGMFLLVEAVRQLRGEAARPPGRRTRSSRCVNGTGGWFSSASTAILGVD